MLVEDHYLETIGSLKLAKEAWEKLKKINCNNALLNTISKMRDLVNIKKDDDMTMYEYVMKILAANRVEQGGFNFDDKTVAGFMFLRLPLEKYEGLIRSLERDEDRLTTETVINRLELEEKHLEPDFKSTKCQEEAKAYAAVGRTDHISRECPHFQGKQAGAPPIKQIYTKKSAYRANGCKLNSFKNVPNSEVPSSATEKEDEEIVAMTVTKCGEDADEKVWVLDSGASHHMTSHQEILQDLEMGIFGEVKLADGKVTEVTGKQQQNHVVVNPSDPTSVEEALASIHRDEWHKAMESEGD
ncbi:uncharacterized protein LOC124718723 [Schistocerca piceifrons]|uniref:uncharacterized protein LOC124718723 n=1 Tax=Schistocerca piceifrons TaxID=274613 RepID=UPI001F5EF2DE|nr:uncharacterized protein LOC124718723 [Schistocerca piceifrons]